jgi:hypothetical protein
VPVPPGALGLSTSLCLIPPPDVGCPHDLRDCDPLAAQASGLGKFRRIDHSGPSASLPLPVETANAGCSFDCISCDCMCTTASCVMGRSG